MVPLTAHLHLVMGILATFLIAALAYNFITGRSRAAGKYILAFTFLAGYTFSLSLPFYVGEGEEFATRGFLFGAAFIVCAYIAAMYMPAINATRLLKRVRNVIVGVFVTLGALSIFIITTNEHAPIVDESGLIFWNAQPFAAWALGAMALVTGLVWAYAHLKTARLVTKWSSRMKGYMLAADGVMWAVAGFIYFPSQNIAQSMLAFVLMIASLLVTGLVFWYIRIRSGIGRS